MIDKGSLSFVVIDGSTVQEPGATETTFLLIYGYAKWMGGQDMADKTALTNGTIPGISSINARIMLYQSMLQITQNYPLLGSGIGSFAAIYPQYRNPAEVSGGYFGHNDYLQFLHEGGPILLLLALLPLILIARLLRHNLQPHPQSTTPALLTSALALAATTFFIHAAADFIFYHIGLNILAGFFLALAYHSSCKPKPLYVLPLSEAKLFSALAPLCLSFLKVFGLVPFEVRFAHRERIASIWLFSHIQDLQQ